MNILDRTRYIPKRYVVAFLAYLGVCCLFLMRTNLSMAVVAMTSTENVSRTNVKEAEFKWSSVETGIILSAFSYGYLFSPVGGLLAIRFGGATVFGLGIVLTGVLTILSPVLIRLNVFVYIFARIMEGVFESFTVASFVNIFVYWALPQEKSRLNVIAFSGCALGNTINYPLSGYIADKFGWESIFYVTGGIAIFWYIAWFLFVSNTPDENEQLLHSEELQYKRNIKNSLLENEKVIYPWKTIFQSAPIWAYMNAMFSVAFSNSFISYCLPLYIKDTYGADIKEIGLISGIPSLLSMIGQFGGAFIADYLRINRKTDISKVHKIFIAFGTISVVLLFMIAGLETDFCGSIICFSLVKLIQGLPDTSFQVLPEDMAYRYASLIKGMGVTSLGIGSILNPIVLGFMVTSHTRSEWNNYFLLVGVFNIWSLLTFQLFGSGELQRWAGESVESKNP